MHLFLVRHFETAWNAKGVLQGRQDISIAKIQPKAKVASICQRLKEGQFHTVFVSPLCRTQQTARLCGFKEYTIDPLLNELDFGPFEGQAKASLQAEYGEQWLNTPSELVLGESLVDLRTRILKFLIKYQQAEKILVFGHGNWIRALMSLVEYGHIDKMNQLSLANGEVIELNFTPKTLQELLDVFRVESS